MSDEKMVASDVGSRSDWSKDLPGGLAADVNKFNIGGFTKPIRGETKQTFRSETVIPLPVIEGSVKSFIDLGDREADKKIIGANVEMQAQPPKPDEVPDWIKAMGLEYGGRGASFEPQVADQFVDAVRKLSKNKANLLLSKEKGKPLEKLENDIQVERERIKELREEIIFDLLTTVDGVQEEMMGFESPYPYESRPGAGFIKSLEDKFEKELTLKRKERYEEESILILRELREAVMWVKGNYHILEGLSSAMRGYYDGELEAEMLYSQYKRIVSGDWRKAFNKEVKGVSLTGKEKDKLVEYGYLDPDKRETFRDNAVRQAADQMFWSMAISSAAQWDHESNSAHGKSMQLNDNELEFVQKLFGVAQKDQTPLDCSQHDFIRYKGKRIPRTVFSWFAIDGATDDRLATFEVMMRVVLERDVRNRFINGEDADRLVNEVKDESRNIINNVGVEAPLDTRGRLSFAIFNQNIIMVNGLMASGDLGWRYDNEVDSQNGKDVLKRKTELGSIYTAFDVATIYYWMLHKIIYDDRGEDRSTLMVPSVGDFRRMFDGMPPDFKLDIYDYCTDVKDEKMLAVLDMLESNTPDMLGKGKSLRTTALRSSGEKFGYLNRDFLNFLKKNMSAFMVPFYEKTIRTPSGEEKPTWLVVPVPIPPVIDSINFFRAAKVYKSLLDRSNDMSTLDYGKLGRHAFDNWRVSTAQMHKWSVFLIGTHDLDRDKDSAYKTWFEKARSIVLKNQAKRGRLGTRMEETEKGCWTLAYAPFLLALSSAKETGLFGMDMTSLTEKSSQSELARFRNRITQWVNIALDMPGNANGVENYNGSMAFMIFWYGMILERIGRASNANYGTNQSDVNGNIINAYEYYEKNFR